MTVFFSEGFCVFKEVKPGVGANEVWGLGGKEVWNRSRVEEGELPFDLYSTGIESWGIYPNENLSSWSENFESRLEVVQQIWLKPRPRPDYEDW